ncbi:MAG TPA: ABC transporter permease [Acidimicrobiia bacterium]|nr:ABC transporter permease [Acidimicrobiia bacterium]
MWKVTYTGLLAKKFRLVLTSLAVVLGVAFMAGTLVLTDTLGNVFDDLFSNATKGVDAVVRTPKPFEEAGQNATSTRTPVPASLVGTIQAVPGVARAQGSVTGFALVEGTNGKAIQNQAPTLGTSWYPEHTEVNTSLDLIHGRQPARASEVALDAKTFEDGKFKIGDRAKISFLTVQPRHFTITGVFEFGGNKNGLAGATMAAFVPSTAQEVMNRVDQWDQIDVRGDSGLSEVQVRDRIQTALRQQGLHYEVITGKKLAEQQSNDIKSNLSFFSTLLLIFALVSLFVGAFIIYNTFSITVAQRLRELGLLRALGASGPQVVGSVAFEAVTVGLLSSILGLVLGIAIVKPLESLLSAFGIDLPTGPLQILPRTIVVALVVGTVVTLVSALAPARRAARIPPIAALRDHAIDVSSGRRRYIWGAVLTLGGLAALGLGLFGPSGGGAAVLTGAAAFLVFIGVAMLSPLLARPATKALTWPAEKTESITGILAQHNAMRNPRRTASTAAALMIGLALVSFIAIFGASAKDSFASAIDDQTHADFILSPKTFQPFSPEAASALRKALPGAQVVEYRFGTVSINGTSHPVNGASAGFEKMTEIGLKPGARMDEFAKGGMVVYKDTASSEGYKVGDRVRVEFPLGPQTLTVQGIYTDKKALPNATNYIISLANWKGFPDPLDFYVGVVKPPGMSTAEAERVVKQVASRYGGIQAQNKAQFRDSQLAMFNQILGLMYVLLLLAVVIALVGIVNTLALSIYERTREIGLLRAVGMSRVQLRRMIRGEALIVASFGALLGLAIGIVFGRAIVQALSDQGIDFTLPVLQLAVFMILAGLAGLLAGVPPARRAAHLDVLRAIGS